MLPRSGTTRRFAPFPQSTPSRGHAAFTTNKMAASLRRAVLTRDESIKAAHGRHVLFTFFSKFFSSFPHGTCSLSVSSEYLALEGYYLPFCAAVPSNTTLWKQFRMVVRIPWTYTGLLPSMARCLNNELLQERDRTSSSRPQFPQVRPGDFRIELSPLHSPLLRGSLLVSFPPLNNMFKFSGSSYLSSAHVLARCLVFESSLEVVRRRWYHLSHASEAPRPKPVNRDDGLRLSRDQQPVESVCKRV